MSCFLTGVTYILEQNVVLIDLYFGKLSYQRVLEEVTYDIFDAIGKSLAIPLLLFHLASIIFSVCIFESKYVKKFGTVSSMT